MTNGGSYPGTISLGDLDMWSFTANTGDNIVLRLGTVGFYGNLSLYGPNGALLKTAASGYDAELAYTATNSGTFTALVERLLFGRRRHLRAAPGPVSRGFHCAPG